MKQLSLLEEIRLEEPALSDVERVQQIAAGLLDKLGLQPPIDPQIIASVQGISRIEKIASPWAGLLLRDDEGFVIRLRSSDSRQRQRFTALHEVAHTFLPGFAVQPQYRCHPDPSRTSTGEEALCDAAAAELLLPRRHFMRDLASSSFDPGTVEALSDRYDASLEATAHRFVDLWPEPALLVALDMKIKPSERKTPTAEPKLRVTYARPSGKWPFIPRHKSVKEDCVPTQARVMGSACGPSDLDGLAPKPSTSIECIALSRTFIDGNGEIRDRVLAIYRQLIGVRS